MNIEIIVNVFLTFLVCRLIFIVPYCVNNWDKDISKNYIGRTVIILDSFFWWASIISGLFLVFAWIWGLK